jgi:hypothetical protein
MISRSKVRFHSGGPASSQAGVLFLIAAEETYFVGRSLCRRARDEFCLEDQKPLKAALKHKSGIWFGWSRSVAIDPFAQLAAQQKHMIIFVNLDEQIATVDGLNHEVPHA